MASQLLVTQPYIGSSPIAGAKLNQTFNIIVNYDINEGMNKQSVVVNKYLIKLLGLLNSISLK